MTTLIIHSKEVGKWREMWLDELSSLRRLSEQTPCRL